MRVWVGIDVAKEIHWATAVDDVGEVLLDRRVTNDPASIQTLVADLTALHGELTIGLDVLGGIAGLLQAMLAVACFHLVHVPGLAVNRARQGTTGGESKSDPRDARVIANQVRTRSDLRPVDEITELEIAIRLVVGRRNDLVQEQTRRLSRLRDLLVGIHPGLEHVLDPTNKASLWLITRYVTPSEIRTAGRAALIKHFRKAKAVRSRDVERLTDAGLSSARAQSVAIPGELLIAELVRELAVEALATKARLTQIEHELKALLERHPDAALIRTLPGMGTTLTCEFLAEAGNLSKFSSADALAAAAGLAPVLRQSGKVRFQRRPTGGNRALKRVFYQAAFCSLQAPDSRAFYQRKRQEGKGHHQAVIALARRRVDVLWAILRSRRPYQPHFKLTPVDKSD
jgi:transposase